MSTVVSIQSLVLIAVGRFGAVVFPLRPPLISSKRCPFLILATWIVAMAIHSPDLFGLKLAETHGVLACHWHWEKAFGESWSTANYFLSLCVAFAFIPFVLIAILYIIIFFKLKSQFIKESRRAIRQHWTTTPAKRTKYVKDGHCYCVGVCSMLAALRYQLVYYLYQVFMAHMVVM